MVLRAFGYAARPKFFDTLADDCLVKYTPFASGVPKLSDVLRNNDHDLSAPQQKIQRGDGHPMHIVILLNIPQQNIRI